jgi:hypothetical protein
MKKSLIFSAVLCGTLAAAPAMAKDVGADFHALSAMSSPVPAMTETEMSSVEGGGPIGSLLLSVVGVVGGLPVVGSVVGGLVAPLLPLLSGL